jgi:hypothetical protein
MLKIVLVVAGTLLATSGAVVAVGELDIVAEQQAYRGMMRSSSGASEQHVRIVGALLSRWDSQPSSAVARRELAFWLRFAPSAVGRPPAFVDEGIIDAARKVATAAPQSGPAWCSLAESAFRYLRDNALLPRAMERCSSTAPVEAEVTARRLQLALVAWPLLSEGLREAAVRDIETLLTSDKLGLRMAEMLGGFVTGVVPERAAEMEHAVSRLDQRVQAVYRNSIDYYRTRSRARQR